LGQPEVVVIHPHHPLHCHLSGQKIYEWDQNLDEVNVYIDLAAGVKAKQLTCDILPNHLRVGIKGNPPYLDVRL
jgi:hypothetical protein